MKMSNEKFVIPDMEAKTSKVKTACTTSPTPTAAPSLSHERVM